MEVQCLVRCLFFIVINLLCWNEISAHIATPKPSKYDRSISSSFNRSSFPSDFVFGASSVAYQYEGAPKEDGKGQSIWDTFAHNSPGKIFDQNTGDVAVDFYHRYKGDVQLMKYIGLDVFKFSISWPRVLPGGKLSKGVNKEGIAFYNNLIDELLANGIQPFAIIFAWDLPQVLEDEYGGFLSPHIIKDFQDFADLCFKEFGDRVKYWSTIYEPYTYATYGYDIGALAPGRCSAWVGNACPAGDSATEPYIVGHHLLLSHAVTVKLYREKYQRSQKGQIGIILLSYWFEPYSESQADVEAAKRALDFMYGWFMEPFTHGDYPKSMKSLVGDRLPKLTTKQSELVKGSLDFLSLDYFTANYAADNPSSGGNANASFSTDFRATLTLEKNGKSIGKPTGVDPFPAYPKGMYDLLVHTKQNYMSDLRILVETGVADSNLTTKQYIEDHGRIEFLEEHLTSLKRAMDDGVNVRGFFIWTLMDNYEWNYGFIAKFGLCFVDRENGLKRYPKLSAHWYKKLIHEPKKFYHI